LLDETRIDLELGTVAGGLSPFDAGGPADSLPEATAAARSLAARLASIIGPPAQAILHYGSRAQGRATRPDSAFDFFIVVDRYRPVYEALARVLGARFRRRLAVLFAWVLPPNAVSLREREPAGEREAKCVIISLAHFRRACSPRARDEFVRARLAQQIVLAWARDAASADQVRRCMQLARESGFQWVRAFLPPRFDVDGYCRTMLAVSLAHEIRLESRDHAETLFAAQRDVLRGLYTRVLEGLAARGVLIRDGLHYIQRQPPGAITRWRVRGYLRTSRWRTTLRLLKHPFLYDGWLDYLLHKIDRSTGEKIVLTPRERRLPFIFLWPRAIRYLRRRPQVQR
jgi:hypothetical protein